MSARLFVAAELPEQVVDALVRWCPSDDALRPVRPESLHVTLAFLGWRDEAEIDVIAPLLDPLARPVRALSVDRVRWLPPRRPRVLAVELADGEGALAALQRAVVTALADAIDWTPEGRPFLAHATVARVRARPPEVGEPPGVDPFAATALTLFRSHMGRGGSRYEALARVPLG